MKAVQLCAVNVRSLSTDCDTREVRLVTLRGGERIASSSSHFPTPPPLLPPPPTAPTPPSKYTAKIQKKNTNKNAKKEKGQNEKKTETWGRLWGFIGDTFVVGLWGARRLSPPHDCVGGPSPDSVSSLWFVRRVIEACGASVRPDLDMHGLIRLAMTQHSHHEAPSQTRNPVAVPHNSAALGSWSIGALRTICAASLLMIHSREMLGIP